MSWNVELEGDFESLSKVVEWLENGKRLIRLDRLVFQGAHGRLTMAMVVRGLALEGAAPTTAPSKGAKPAAEQVKVVNAKDSNGK